MRVTLFGLTILIVVLALSGQVFAQVGREHKDENLGYKVRTPKDWKVMPISTDERWIAAQFLSDREYVVEGWSFKPAMKVVIFPFSVTKDRGIKKTEEETDDGTTVTLTIKNPYKNYKDYLKKTYRGGGWHISEEKEMKNKDVDWTLYEIKVEKLAYGGAKRLIAGIFHAGDADFVVQFEVLEKNYKKHRNTVFGCLKSFQFIARKGSLAPTATGDIKITDEKKMTPAERKKHREEKQRIAFRNSIERLPDGWTSFESDGFLVLTHVDKKFSMKVVKQAAAVKKWLEKTFPFMGKEYVRPLIIRICDSWDEERSYRGTGSFFSSSSEIVTHKNVGAGAKSFEFEWVNRRVVDAWFFDKDPDIAIALPRWFTQGLGQYVGTATLKGNRMQFKPDQWELEPLRIAKKAGELAPVESLLQMTGQNFWQKRHHSPQAAALLRFLLDGPGRGLKGAKTFLEDYIAALRDYVNERNKAEDEKDPEASEAPKTEEEEEERFKKRQQQWSERAQELLDEVFKRAFENWSESTWKKLEGSYRQFVS